MSTTELTTRLDQIQLVYDIYAMIQQKPDAHTIVHYYTQVYPAYSLFHSMDGCIHLALNYDGKLDRDGYYEPLRLIEGQLEKVTAAQPKQYLELASGRGFNSTYLAQRHSTDQFVGIDRTPVHVRTAIKKAQKMKLRNIRFIQGDFHCLSFLSESFDGIYVVESTCYARDMRLVIEEAYRLLKPGRPFILVDMFKKKDLSAASDEQRIASLLIEKSMAIDSVVTWDTFLHLAKNAGFEIALTRDLSDAIMPNLLAFETLSARYFRIPALARAIKKVLPPYLLQSVIAGLLMPTIVRQGVEGYFMAVMVRP
jgi:ubiquinone/menaquinone biosynthesis C-methylase UbiE